MKKTIGKILLGMFITIVMFSFYIVKADENENTEESKNKTEAVDGENKIEPAENKI